MSYFVWFILLAIVSSSSAQDIFESARDGDLPRVRELLEADPSRIKAKNEILKTAVHYAAQSGHLDIVRYLHEQGADLEAPNISDETPLLYAVYFGHTAVVAYLIDQGVDINGKTSDGDTSLDMAVMQEHEEIITLLRKHGGVETVVGAPQTRQLATNIRQVTFPYGQTPNLCQSTGTDGTLLVDTGYQRNLDALRTYLQEIAVETLPFIINTHQHYDHNGANAVADDQTLIIDLDTLEQHVRDGVVKPGEGPVRGRSGKSFPKYYTLNFNGEEIRLIPSPGAHTDKDMIVHFTGSNIVHMGDLLIAQSFPSVSEAVTDYLDILDTTIDVFAEDTILVCGHGRESSIAEVRRYRQMLIEVMELVTARLDKGVDIEDIREMPELQKFESYGHFIPQLNSDYWVNAVGRFYELSGS